MSSSRLGCPFYWLLHGHAWWARLLMGLSTGIVCMPTMVTLSVVVGHFAMCSPNACTSVAAINIPISAYVISLWLLLSCAFLVGFLVTIISSLPLWHFYPPFLFISPIHFSDQLLGIVASTDIYELSSSDETSHTSGLHLWVRCSWSMLQVVAPAIWGVPIHSVWSPL